MTAYARDIEDTYEKGGTTYLRRWSVTLDGLARCVEDAVELPHPDEAAIRASNAQIKQTAQAFQDWWNARRVPEPSADTPKEVDEYDLEGNVVGTKPHPDWKAYDDAQAVIAATSQDVFDLAIMQQGEPEQTDEQGNITAGWQTWADARDRIASAYRTAW